VINRGFVFMKTLSASEFGMSLPKNEDPPNSLGSEAEQMLQALAEPGVEGESKKQKIERVARLLGFTYWRAFDVWYGKARRIEDHEYAALNEALDKKKSRDIRNELHDLRLRLARLESVLTTQDPEFHRPTLDALGEQVRRHGGSLGKGVKR
jgi:hypothetical protein